MLPALLTSFFRALRGFARQSTDDAGALKIEVINLPSGNWRVEGADVGRLGDYPNRQEAARRAAHWAVDLQRAGIKAIYQPDTPAAVK